MEEAPWNHSVVLSQDVHDVAGKITVWRVGRAALCHPSHFPLSRSNCCLLEYMFGKFSAECKIMQNIFRMMNFFSSVSWEAEQLNNIYTELSTSIIRVLLRQTKTLLIGHLFWLRHTGMEIGNVWRWAANNKHYHFIKAGQGKQA